MGGLGFTLALLLVALIPVCVHMAQAGEGTDDE